MHSIPASDVVGKSFISCMHVFGILHLSFCIMRIVTMTELLLPEIMPLQALPIPKLEGIVESKDLAIVV